MIAKRTLMRWRREALWTKDNMDYKVWDGAGCPALAKSHKELCERILHMTQELLDQHLMKGR